MDALRPYVSITDSQHTVHGSIGGTWSHFALADGNPSPLSWKSCQIQQSKAYTITQSVTNIPQFADHFSNLVKLLMEHLPVRPSESSSVKTRALDDAHKMQLSVNESAKKAGKDPPNYVLVELIGKGSFGRVYKGKEVTTARLVAVKIINMDESDTVNPRNADSYSEFLKEIGALKLLSKNKARNVNHIIDALLVCQTMWMVTEYCGGGSVATLMKPTPRGLQEKWIIPILREVAEALRWVHQAGIIHRDIKCANILVTEQGDVQLCDFGVAGIVETKLDKRSTFIGTPHWMAPELFDSTQGYGKEVDIWAFGSMVHEIATGLPPNAANGISYKNLGTHFKSHMPKLEGGDYSTELRGLVACCLVELPGSRPTIDQIQSHPYIHNTNLKYPTSTLSYLVRAFKLWESRGGSRKSLFMLGGAQGLSEVPLSQIDNEWNFSTTAAFDQEVSRESTAQDIYEAYSTQVELDVTFAQEPPGPSVSKRQKGARRRIPPEALAPLRVPLQKVFDPNTISNYEDNSRNHYYRPLQEPPSDLPLRDNSAQSLIRDTMVDLSDNCSETILPNSKTIKAVIRGKEPGPNGYFSDLSDSGKPGLSGLADTNNNRRTLDWKFPSTAPPTTTDAKIFQFTTSYELPQIAIIPGSSNRPLSAQYYTEPIGIGCEGFPELPQQAKDRFSTADSLIDLDMSLPDSTPVTRPSTATSDTESLKSEQGILRTSFELEHDASLSQLIPGDQNLAGISDFSESDAEGGTMHSGPSEIREDQGSGVSELDYFSIQPPQNGLQRLPIASQNGSQRPSMRRPDQQYTLAHLLDLPAPPSLAAMTGIASDSEMLSEILRMVGGLKNQLIAFQDIYKSL